MCKKSFFLIPLVVVLGLAGLAHADPITQDSGPDGIVSIEAENFDENVPEQDHFWEFNTDIPDFSGDGFMRALPDGTGGGNPRLNYEVNFVKTGIHYVWVRGYSTSGTDDSCHAGLDGDETTAGSIQAGGGNGPWVWSINRRDSAGLAQLDVTSVGVHTVHVRMREDGWRFDKIVLTTNPDYTPADLGPDESWRGPRIRAYNPLPEDGAQYLDTWVSLAWSGGETAATRDVYFGTNFDDVNDGVGGTFQGNQTADFLIVGFPGFAFPEGLPAGITYYWRVDEIEADGTTKHKGFVWSFTIPSRKAYAPFPADGARHVFPDDTTLNWTKGLNAKLHTVYFGDNFDDVNSGATAIPRGTPNYSPGTLASDTVYYWRVDQFDGLATHKGDVWSFRTLPEIPITDPSLVGWWKLDADSGTVAVDWSGNGNHGTLQGDPQWVPGQVGGALAFDGSGDYVDCGDSPSLTITGDITVMCWIKVAAFTKTWETILGKGDDSYRMSRGPSDGDSIHFGASGTGTNLDANTEVTTDTWRHVAAVYDGTNKIVYIDGAEDARLASTGPIDTSSYNLFIGANSQQVGRNLTGLVDDVRIYNRVLTLDEIKQAMRGELDLAWDPVPTNGSIPPQKEATPLTWSPGDDAAEHDVYFGADRDAVMDADVSDVTGIYRGRQGGTSHIPSEGVEWGGGPYYWRIDQVNTDGTISKGRVWSFTVSDFVLVEDFEGYTDDDAANEAIWQHWIDGFGVPTNGSQVGYVLPPYAEQMIVNGGRQSMPLSYENTAGVTNSQAELTLTAPRDWTEGSVGELSIWFHGRAGSAGSFTEGPVGTYTITSRSGDIWNQADEFHYAYKTLTGAGTIVARIDSVVNTAAWTKCGVMIRETLDPGSKFAAVYVMAANADGTPTQGARFQARTDTDGSATSDTSVATAEQMAITAPYWVKLERDVAGNFRGSYSSNGSTWQSMVWRPSVSMGSTIYVGLALTSNNTNAVAEAKISNVTITGTAGAQWANQDIGIAANAAEPLYVAISNATGAPAVVAHPDPAAANITTWTEWVIPLQAFADKGINLANVDKIAVGLGSAGGAASGGSGVMYIDDVRLYRTRGAAGQ